MPNVTNTRFKHLWLFDVLFLLVLALAGYLRLTGVNWGEGQYQHPDENFLTSVLGSLQAHKCADETIPVEACPPEQKHWIGLGDYFNTTTSTLNPYNRGFSFFVYGNLPMTLIRVIAEATDQIDVKLLGRQFSAFADLFTILLLYFIVSRLYGRPVGLLAALFSALTVMQIQQSHFVTTDLFVNAFAFLAIWFALAILEYKEKRVENRNSTEEPTESLQLVDNDSHIADPQDLLRAQVQVPPIPDAMQIARHPLFLLSIGF